AAGQILHACGHHGAAGRGDRGRLAHSLAALGLLPTGESPGRLPARAAPHVQGNPARATVSRTERRSGEMIDARPPPDARGRCAMDSTRVPLVLTPYFRNSLASLNNPLNRFRRLTTL